MRQSHSHIHCGFVHSCCVFVAFLCHYFSYPIYIVKYTVHPGFWNPRSVKICPTLTAEAGVFTHLLIMFNMVWSCLISFTYLDKKFPRLRRAKPSFAAKNPSGFRGSSHGKVERFFKRPFLKGIPFEIASQRNSWKVDEKTGDPWWASCWIYSRKREKQRRWVVDMGRTGMTGTGSMVDALMHVDADSGRRWHLWPCLCLSNVFLDVEKP